MPKSRTVLTAKQQILITLTYRKISGSPSEIEKILGFKSSQINRDLYETAGLVYDGLVDKDHEGSLFLTEKGKSDPLVSMFLLTRRLGSLILFLGVFMSAHVIIGSLLNLISNTYYIALQTLTALMFLVLGWYMNNYPRLLLRAAHNKEYRSNDQDK